MLKLLAVVFFSATCSAQTIVAPEKVLAKHLINKYDDLGIAGRPVVNISDTVQVTVGFNLNKIIKSEKNYLTVSAILMLQWTDPFLDWDPATFSGATSIALPSDTIWTPDVIFFNNDYHHSDEMEAVQDADVLVSENGHVIWARKMIIKASCKDDPATAATVATKQVQKTCTFTGGSWVHDSAKLAIILAKPDIDLEMFEPSVTSDLVSHLATVEQKAFTCCPGVTFDMFHFNLVVKKVTQCEKGGKCDKAKQGNKQQQQEEEPAV